MAGPGRVAQVSPNHIREPTRQAAHLILLSGNLMSLYREYQRTECRACVLEDVLLPKWKRAPGRSMATWKRSTGGGGADEVRAERVRRGDVLAQGFRGCVPSGSIETLSEPLEMARRSIEWESAAKSRKATAS